MTILLDLIIINASAVMAFLLREYRLNFIDELPSIYLIKYFTALFAFNIIYFFISWLVGLYDKRHKRALLEEFLLIFGIFLMCMAVMIAILFLSRFWWVSRIIVYLFWVSSVLMICVAHYLTRANIASLDVLKNDLSEIKTTMSAKKPNINSKLSIIIVNTNEKQKLVNCLDSIKAAGISFPLEIVVVDNISSDGTVEYLAGQYPRVKIVKNPDNLGYARSVNNGLRVATSDLCLILNPDIIVLPGAIEIMVDYMFKNPKAGIVGCKLFNEDGSLQHSVRRFLDLRTYLYMFTPLRGLMTGSAIERYYLMQDWDHNDNRIVDWVLGGCMLVKRAAFEQVGMMDEKIFLYFDDVDWCYRMWDKGWQIGYVAEAGMIHKHMRASANKILNRATYEHFKSLFYFLRKHGLRLPGNCPSSLE